jgi:hypothetical protein
MRIYTMSMNPCSQATWREVRPSFDPLLTYTPLQIRNWTVSVNFKCDRIVNSVIGNDGETPLICACRMEHEKIVHLLLENGANTNKMDATGLTPTMFGGCAVWTFIGSSSWFYSHYIWWMCCLNFCRVQFLVLLTTHPPNIAGVRPGTGPYKSSDSTSTKHSGSKTRNWTL